MWQSTPRCYACLAKLFLNVKYMKVNEAAECLVVLPSVFFFLPGRKNHLLADSFPSSVWLQVWPFISFLCKDRINSSTQLVLFCSMINVNAQTYTLLNFKHQTSYSHPKWAVRGWMYNEKAWNIKTEQMSGIICLKKTKVSSPGEGRVWLFIYSPSRLCYLRMHNPLKRIKWGLMDC